MPGIHLRPLGLILGDAAGAARDAGFALPLQGDDALAFTGCETFLSDGSGPIRTTVVAAAALPEWLDRLAPPVAAAARVLLERLMGPPLWPDSLPPPPLLMGVINVTPDSFSDGGRFFDTARAIEQGRRLAAEGAAIIDVGGESTRPGARPVSADEETGRIEPVVRALASDGILVSIDTRKAAVMRAALAAGAGMINDVTALRGDPDTLQVACASNVPVVLMHMLGEPATMQQAPHYRRACLDVYDFLDERVSACEAAGIERRRLTVDPGIGFGKTLWHNLDILSNLDLYRALGLPLALGVSRKSFIGRLAGAAAPGERLPGSIAAGLSGFALGASILRVHDVAPMQQALRLWRAMGRSSGINQSYAR